MPVIQDFTLNAGENGVLTVSMAPPTSISGWSLQFDQVARPGGVPVITKSVASGFAGVSGMNVTNGQLGTFSVSLYPPEASGLDLLRGAWFYTVRRTDSGYATTVSEGYRLMKP